jgi:hypothetical protein
VEQIYAICLFETKIHRYGRFCGAVQEESVTLWNKSMQICLFGTEIHRSGRFVELYKKKV